MEEKKILPIGAVPFASPMAIKFARKQSTIDDLFDKNFGLQKGNLWVQVLEGKNFAKKSSVYCEMVVEGRPKRTTTLNGTKSLFWNEELNFEVEDEETTTITIRVCSKKTLGMKKVLGELKIPILDQFLEANSAHHYEGWFVIPTMKSKKTSSSSAGFLQLRMRYISKHERNVFYRLASSYRPQLMELFRGNDQMLLDLCRFQNNEKLSKTLVRLLSGISADKVINFLVKNVSQEVQRGEKETVLRNDTMGVRCLISYIKMEVTSYLADTVGDLIGNLLKLSISYELDPTKEKPAVVAQNQTKMEETVAKFFKAITSSVARIPNTVATLILRLHTELSKVFDDEKKTQDILCRFFFLRLICSSIVNPKMFKLWGDIDDMKITKTLAIISKCLQLAANNDSTFKEEHLQFLSPIVSINIVPVHNFFKAIFEKATKLKESSAVIESKGLTQEQEKKCICILLTLYEEVSEEMNKTIKKEQRMSRELEALQKIVDEKDTIQIPELKIIPKPNRPKSTMVVILQALPSDFSYIPRSDTEISEQLMHSNSSPGSTPKMSYKSSYRNFNNMFPVSATSSASSVSSSSSSGTVLQTSPSEGSLSTIASEKIVDDTELFRSRSSQQ